MSRSPSRIQLKLPRAFQAVLLGLGLGMIASVATTFVFFLIALFVGIMFPIPTQTPSWVSKIIAVPRMIYVEGPSLAGPLYLPLIITIFTFVPCTIGGGVIGMLLDRLASFRLSTRAVLVVGALVGFAAGGYTAAFLFFPESYLKARAYLLVRDVLETGTVGALVGIAHSWILARWLKGRINDLGDDSDSMGAYGRIAVGFIVAGITLGLILMTQPSAGWLYNSLRNPLWVGGIAMLGGVFASWPLGIWLKWRANKGPALGNRT